MAAAHQTDATVQSHPLGDIRHHALVDSKVATESEPRLLVGCIREAAFAPRLVAWEIPNCNILHPEARILLKKVTAKACS